MRSYRLFEVALLVSMISTFVLSGDVLADTTSASADSRHGRHNGSPSSSQSTQKSSGMIQGVCSIVPSATNPIPGPCVNVLLVFTASKGNEISVARTSPQGQFEFIAEKGQTYQITPSSKSYELVEPLGNVTAGQKISLKIQQK